MVIYMQRYFTNTIKENEFILKNDDLYHIYKVMRMKNNDKIEVIYNKTLYLCELIDKKIIIKEKKEKLNNKKKEIILCTPLLKEQKMDIVIQKATELGVNKIIPVNMKRSIVRIDPKKEIAKLERWNKIVKEASEQSKRLDIPVITSIKNIAEIDENGLKLLCSTSKHILSIKNVLKKEQNYDKIIIVFGPEGGIATEEENKLKKLGFVAVSFGDNILRTETVPLYVLSILNYENME